MFRCRKVGRQPPLEVPIPPRGKKLKETFNMKVRAHNARRLSITLAILIGTSGIALAQEAQIAPGSEQPMFTVLKPALHAPQNQAEARILAATTPLQTWNGSFSFSGTTYNYNMVGTKPS